jgi:hypothetical protein
MDLWVYKEQYKNELDWAYIYAELDTIHLKEFADNVLGLCGVWFADEKSCELYEEMTQYIISSGLYGTKKNSIISLIYRKKGKKIPKPKLTYMHYLFFPSLTYMKSSYPILTTWSFLLPVCWVLRGIKCLIFKRRNTFHKIEEIRSMANEDIVHGGNLHRKAGLL